MAAVSLAEMNVKRCHFGIYGRGRETGEEGDGRGREERVSGDTGWLENGEGGGRGGGGGGGGYSILLLLLLPQLLMTSQLAVREYGVEREWTQEFS